MYKEMHDPNISPEEVQALLLGASNWSQQKEILSDVHRLAFEQAVLRAENPAWLPPLLKDEKRSQRIIGHALKERRMEAGLLALPDARTGLPKGAGLLLLNPLWAEVSGKMVHGHQIDDVIVDKQWRGKNIGQYAISYAAFLAERRGGSAVGWECEEDNPAQKVYRLMEAEKRREKPFRITFKQICRLLAERQDDPSVESRLVSVERLQPSFNSVVDATNMAAARELISDRYLCKLEGNNRVLASCLISQRVSVLRLLGYKPDGVHKEGATGYQIESIRVNLTESREQRSDCAVKLVEEAIMELSALENGCDFIDVVGSPDDPLVQGVAVRFDANLNSYTGSGSVLWILQGEAFENAVRVGSKLTRVIC